MNHKEIEEILGLKLQTLIIDFNPRYIDSLKWVRTFGDRYEDLCGVYYFLTKDYNILYIGQSTQVDKRIKSHCGNRNKEGHWMNKIEFVAFRKCDLSLRLKIEKKEILKYTPKYNDPDKKTKLELLDVKTKWDIKNEMLSLNNKRVMILNDLNESTKECEILNNKIHKIKERLENIDVEIAIKQH